ncbi:hypothetical protein GGR28_002243 [Lewinella aquimaris]|uniref:Uncharacterized protein n=1 Tax=Neolewinella aquimaris TaxID=1835722 RepID=A0A840ECA0_9BACT|nr:hypothetical protein [Neolewinella aquimaris]MBB4079618.1 hypothetical protein [Neolewinella aquimaris]
MFENHYHYGLGALINSLYSCEYRGVIYAGYRGELPPWAVNTVPLEGGITAFEVVPELTVHFAYQETDEMLANIKPALIQQVWERYGPEVETVFYIDCDIVIKAKWEHFEAWAQHGVAMCEDMNSPIPPSHPLRLQWQAYYAKFGIDYQPRDAVYVNGGFVGINRRDRGFAERWEEVQQYMKLHTGKQDRIGIADRWNMFHFMDQDALNVTKDLVERVSLMGPDAMDFHRYGYVMSHAAGRSKPWSKHFVSNVLKTGERPSFTDKLYWRHVSHPIKLFSASTIRRKLLTLNIAVFIGRLFTRT